MQPEWIDDFLFLDLIAVTSLVFIDWLLGKEQRGKLKEKVGGWYLFLADNSYGQLIENDVKKFHKLLARHFGEVTFSKHRIISTFIVSFIITIIVFSILYLTAPEIGKGEDFQAAIYSSIFPNMVGDWLSVSISILLLNWMLHKASIKRYIAIIALDITVATLLLALALFITIPTLSLFSLEEFNIPHVPGDGVGGFFAIIIASIVVFFTAALPTVIHILYACYLILSKVTGGVLRGPVSLIMLRFYESDKGVLTQVSIGLGVVAKLSQETVKYFV